MKLYPYEILTPFFMAAIGNPTPADKVAANAAKVSERQIRKARIDGMDDFLLDKISMGLGFHPCEVVGQDEWIANGLNMPDKTPRRRRKVEVSA